MVNAKYLRMIRITVILLLITGLLSACLIGDPGPHCSSTAVAPPQDTNIPLTTSVSVFDQAPLLIGKIYLYQHYLLINSPYKGIYIYDNSDSSAPLPLVYIDIPGNVDMAVKDGYLYADSYQDLVTIKLVDDFGNVVIDVDTVGEVDRIENVFPNYNYNLGNDTAC